jgi:hypothetical protein
MNSGKKRPQGGGNSKSRPGQGKGRSFGGKKAGADDRKPRKRFEDSGDKPRKRFVSALKTLGISRVGRYGEGRQAA